MADLRGRDRPRVPRVPVAERAATVVLASNYGEAGAIELLGPKRGLPRAYSGQNAFAEWGHPGPEATHVMLLGYDAPSDIPSPFTDCRRLATINNGYGLDNDEQGGPVLFCRSTSDWATMWPHLRHYN